MRGINFGSPIANDRLMKELRDIFRSENYKNGITQLHRDVFSIFFNIYFFL